MRRTREEQNDAWMTPPFLAPASTPRHPLASMRATLGRHIEGGPWHTATMRGKECGMAIELVPLATATAVLAPPIMLPNTPAGTRVIFEITDYRWEGARFTAR